jgi:hypothetical protein
MNMQIHTPPGKWARGDKEKADLFAEHLQVVFTPHSSIQVQEVDVFLNEPIQSPQRQKLFTLKELQDAVNTLKTKHHGFSRQANYTDRATAACRRS